jgi:4'-phosphopantetheinyl transferase
MVSWESLPDRPILDTNHIHIWLGSPDVSSGAVRHYESIISPWEKERSRQFLRTKDRHFYVVGRGMLRRLLSHYLDVNPSALVLKVNPQGKPFLAPGQAPGVIHFNISHSQKVILMAFSKESSLGVDVEFTRRKRDYMAVASRYLSARDLSVLQSLAVKKRREFFYECWVKKEAVLKLAGEGVFAAAGREEGLRKGTYIYALDAPPDYVAALACKMAHPIFDYFNIE